MDRKILEFAKLCDNSYVDIIDNISYIALKLDNHSKAKLAKFAYTLFGNKYNNVYCDHITLAYGYEQILQFDMTSIGQSAVLNINRIVFDKNAAAAVIDKKDLIGITYNNVFPHITLFTKTGIKPVYSNQLMINVVNNANSVNILNLHNILRLNAVITIIKKDNI